MANRANPDNVWQWLVEQGEEKVSQVAGEVLQNPRVTEAVAGALKRAAETKGQVDKNLERVLGALNVTTRSDHEKLMAKVEALQGSLVNINIKLDRLLAEREPKKRPAPRRAPKAAKKSEKPRS
ncbi:MAG: hypothetical protein P8R42_17295 [Candidatus Binatia bacterium]|nr:hypothetical protein [Candidatus Binatia bacterium]